MNNAFGHIFKFTSFGESHGVAIGGVIDGVPANINIDLTKIKHQLNRRKPGQSNITTQRKEDDVVEFLSGIFEGKTTGAPIGFNIKNTNQKSIDYSHLNDVFRPSHADYTYQKKYKNRDYRGGGRSSARETAIRVVVGSIAYQIIHQLFNKHIEITAYVSQVGEVSVNRPYQDLDFDLIDNNNVRCPDENIALVMESLIKATKKQGDTVGGQITCVVQNLPVGIGEPVYNKLNAQLANAMFSINAVKGFELGSGFRSISMFGSEHNDEFYLQDKIVKTKTNFSGGIQGGISNGEDIYFNVAFKPVATLMQKQQTINDQNKTVTLLGKGRHDPCVVPRAVPIVEAMTAIVLLDSLLINKALQY
jgi:chorismate synthase